MAKASDVAAGALGLFAQAGQTRVRNVHINAERSRRALEALGASVEKFTDRIKQDRIKKEKAQVAQQVQSIFLGAKDPDLVRKALANLDTSNLSPETQEFASLLTAQAVESSFGLALSRERLESEELDQRRTQQLIDLEPEKQDLLRFKATTAAENARIRAEAAQTSAEARVAREAARVAEADARRAQQETIEYNRRLDSRLKELGIQEKERRDKFKALSDGLSNRIASMRLDKPGLSRRNALNDIVTDPELRAEMMGDADEAIQAAVIRENREVAREFDLEDETRSRRVRLEHLRGVEDWVKTRAPSMANLALSGVEQIYTDRQAALQTVIDFQNNKLPDLTAKVAKERGWLPEGDAQISIEEDMLRGQLLEEFAAGLRIVDEKQYADMIASETTRARVLFENGDIFPPEGEAVDVSEWLENIATNNVRRRILQSNRNDGTGMVGENGIESMTEDEQEQLIKRLAGVAGE